MCGIFACIHCQCQPFDPTLKVAIEHCCTVKDARTHTQAQLVEKLRRRGPDYMGEAILSIGNTIQLEMIGTLLHMRGAKPTPQPLRGNGSVGDTKSTRDNILLWNGNIFGGEIEVASSWIICSCHIHTLIRIHYLLCTHMRM